MSGIDEQTLPVCEHCYKSDIGWLIREISQRGYKETIMVINLDKKQAREYGEYNLFIDEKCYEMEKQKILHRMTGATCRSCDNDAGEEVVLLLKEAIKHERRRYPNVWTGRAR